MNFIAWSGEYKPITKEQIEESKEALRNMNPKPVITIIPYKPTIKYNMRCIRCKDFGRCPDSRK